MSSPSFLSLSLFSLLASRPPALSLFHAGNGFAVLVEAAAAAAAVLDAAAAAAFALNMVGWCGLRWAAEWEPTTPKIPSSRASKWTLAGARGAYLTARLLGGRKRGRKNARRGKVNRQHVMRAADGSSPPGETDEKNNSSKQKGPGSSTQKNAMIPWDYRPRPPSCRHHGREDVGGL